MADHARNFFLRFGYLESIANGDPDLEPSPEGIAALRGLGVEEYLAIRAQLEEEAAVASAELDDAEWLQRLDSVPWRGKVVVAIGDSITADLQSWARILSAAVKARPAHSETRMYNLAVSGETTTGLLSRLPAILDHKPDYVLVMIGTNDACRFPPGYIPWISDQETARNLSTFAAALLEAETNLVWIAPPPLRVDEIERHWYVGKVPGQWSAEVHERKRQIVLSQEGMSFDTATVLGRKADDYLDGLHPSLEGHLRLVKGLVDASAGAD